MMRCVHDMHQCFHEETLLHEVFNTNTSTTNIDPQNDIKPIVNLLSLTITTYNVKMLQV